MINFLLFLLTLILMVALVVFVGFMVFSFDEVWLEGVLKLRFRLWIGRVFGVNTNDR